MSRCHYRDGNWHLDVIFISWSLLFEEDGVCWLDLHWLWKDIFFSEKVRKAWRMCSHIAKMWWMWTTIGGKVRGKLEPPSTNNLAQSDKNRGNLEGIRKKYKMKTSSSSRSLTPSPLSSSLTSSPSPSYSVSKKRCPFDQKFIERYPAAFAAHKSIFNR